MCSNHSKNFRKNEAGTAGLPLRILVLTIVGMAGFAATLAAVSETPTPPAPMYAKANLSELSLSSVPAGLLVTVLDRENLGIEDANVIIRSPDRKAAFSGVTDATGVVRIELLNFSLPAGKNEGYLGVKVMKNGYRDYTDEYFVKVTGA